MTPELLQARALPLAGAAIKQARWNPGGHTFELLLRCQDPRRGPLDLLLRYRGVRSLEPALPALAALVEDASLTLAASVFGAADGAPSHCIQLAPAGGLKVAFAALEWSEQLGTGADYGAPGYRFQILSC